MATHPQNKCMLQTAGKILMLLLACTFASTASADITVETVVVGNPGNAGQLSGAGAGGTGPDRVCGAVDYVYNMGKYEITTGQYALFLNAVAATDQYGLYHEFMSSEMEAGCMIERQGTPGSYTYSVPTGYKERPVNYVDWCDAARFANWMHNGQPVGEQDLSTTEDGSYFINGIMEDTECGSITREADATWVIPSEDEWYKSAFHKNTLADEYYAFPTSNDDFPDNGIPYGDTGNSANFLMPGAGYAIGEPYFRNEVGYYSRSESPYGTYDQGGNVWEWCEETGALGHDKLMRGQGWANPDGFFMFMHSSVRMASWGGSHEQGFRLALVPEPSTISLLILGSMAIIRRRK